MPMSRMEVARTQRSPQNCRTSQARLSHFLTRQFAVAAKQAARSDRSISIIPPTPRSAPELFLPRPARIRSPVRIREPLVGCPSSRHQPGSHRSQSEPLNRISLKAHRLQSICENPSLSAGRPLSTSSQPFAHGCPHKQPSSTS